MPTEIVLNEDDDCFHEKHPDLDGETFCGLSFSQDAVARYASFGARYADDTRAQVAAEEEKDFCRDCEEAASEWADSV